MMGSCYFISLSVILSNVWFASCRYDEKFENSYPSACTLYGWNIGDRMICFSKVNAAMTWYNAQEYCRKFNSHLPVFEKSIAYEIDTIPSLFLSELGNIKGQWSGLHFVNGRLWWEYDIPIPANPEGDLYKIKDNAVNDTVEHCGYVAESFNDLKNVNVSLKFYPCSHRKKFTCFRKYEESIEIEEDERRCPLPWHTTPELDYCFFKSEDTKTFEDAKRTCRDNNSKIWNYTEDYELAIMERYVEKSRNSSDEFYVEEPVVSPSTSVEQKDIEGKKCNFILGNSLVQGNCSIKRKYICQLSAKKLVAEITLKNSTREMTTIDNVHYLRSSNVRNTGMKCSRNIRKNVWLKDQIYLPELYIDDSTFHTVSDFTSHVHHYVSVYLAQGTYQCQVWQPKSGRTKSNPETFMFTDVLTSWLYLVAEIDSKTDFSMYAMPRENKLELSRLFKLSECEVLMGRIDTCFYPDSIVKNIHNISKSERTKITIKIAVFSNISSSASFKYFSEPGLPNRLQLTFMKDYFQKIERLVKNKLMKITFNQNDFLELLNKKIILSRKKRQAKISRDVRRESPLDIHSEDLKREIIEFQNFYLKSSQVCYPTVHSFPNGTIRFETIGLHRDEANSTSVCLNKDLTPLARGRCEGDFGSGYAWKIVLYYECRPDKDITSTVTDDLINTFNGVGTSVNISDIDRVANITASHSKEMSHTDVNLVGRFVETAANTTELTEQVGQTLMNIVSNAMEAPLNTSTKSLDEKERVVESKLRLINSLETVASKVQLTTSNVTWKTNQFLVHIDESTGSGKGFGVIVGVDGHGKPDTHVSGDEVVVNKDIHAGIFIPEKAYEKFLKKDVGVDYNDQKKARTSFIMYKSESIFHNPNCQDDEGNDIRVNSYVISGAVDGVKIENLTDKVKLRFKLHKQDAPNRSCAFAEKSLIGNTWQWSQRGLILESYDNKTGMVECSSDHMTNFAVLAGFCMHPSTSVAKALTYISILGTMLSIICLSLVVVCQIFFKKFRKGQYQLAILNLSIALIAVNLLVLLGIDRINNRVGCMVIAALLHYFLLVAFSWMLIEAVLQYYKFVKVFNVHVRKFVIKTVLPAWILPAVVVAITACIDYNQFRGPTNYCWLAKDAFHFAFLLPLGIIVLTNIFIFIRIIKGISCDRPKGMQTNQTKSQLIWLQVQAGICCFVVMGLTWCFALFAFGKAALVMQFLFAIFNSLQGFFVFVLFNLREKPVRKAWYELLCKRKSGKKNFTSSESGGFKTNFRKKDKQDGCALSSSDHCSPKKTASDEALSETNLTKS